jgi:hypothetical protein
MNTRKKLKMESGHGMVRVNPNDHDYQKNWPTIQEYQDKTQRLAILEHKTKPVVIKERYILPKTSTSSIVVCSTTYIKKQVDYNKPIKITTKVVKEKKIKDVSIAQANHRFITHLDKKIRVISAIDGSPGHHYIKYFKFNGEDILIEKPTTRSHTLTGLFLEHKILEEKKPFYDLMKEERDLECECYINRIRCCPGYVREGDDLSLIWSKFSEQKEPNFTKKMAQNVQLRLKVHLRFLKKRMELWAKKINEQKALLSNLKEFRSSIVTIY